MERSLLIAAGLVMLLSSVLFIGLATSFGIIVDLLGTPWTENGGSSGGGAAPVEGNTPLKSNGPGHFDSSDLAVLVVISIAMAGTIGLRQVILDVGGERLVVRLRKHVFTALCKKRMAFFDLHKPADLQYRLCNDTVVIQRLFVAVVSAAWNGVEVVGGVTFCAIISWKLTVPVLVCLPTLCTVTYCYDRHVERLTLLYEHGQAEAEGEASEYINNIRTVRAFGKDGKAQVLRLFSLPLSL